MNAEPPKARFQMEHQPRRPGYAKRYPGVDHLHAPWYSLKMKVREAIKKIEADRWTLVATRGSHRQDKHPSKPGRVTIVANPAMIWLPAPSTASSNKRG